jgi:hypothetical protein
MARFDFFSLSFKGKSVATSDCKSNPYSVNLPTAAKWTNQKY